MGAKQRTTLTPLEEQQFQNWYARFQKSGGEYQNANPNHPEVDYDYRAAFRAGAKPWHDKKNNVWMWPEEFQDDYYESTTGNIQDEYDTDRPPKSSKGFRGLIESLTR